MPNPETDAVRAFERVIDEGYRDLPIFSRPLGVALYGLLAAYDSHIVTQILVQEGNGDAPLSVGQVQMFKCRAEGLVWAVRWLLEARQVPAVCSVAEEEVIAEAASLVEYGAKYFTVGMMYSHFSRGSAQATVDMPSKRMRFDYTPEYRRLNCSWGFHDDVSNETLQKTARDEQRVSSLKLAASRAIHLIPHHAENGRIILDDPRALAAPEIQAWSAAMCSSQHIFPAEHDMGGFAMQEFGKFWQALTAWSVCVTELYLSAWNQGVPQETCMPTQVVPRSHFLAVMTELSGLNRDVVERIAAKMTFDWRTKNPDPFLQPLFCGESNVAWSPALVQMSRFQRNLLKLMARTPAEKAIADRIIGEREQRLLQQLKVLLERKGWSVTVNKEIRGEEIAEVDLLAVNWHFPQEVMVVEAKAFLQVDDVNEIKSATVEMQHAQEQIGRIIRILSAMPIDQKQHLFPSVEWEKVERWFGVIVTPETEPGINFDHSNVPAASMLTLQTRLRAKDWVGPRRIWQAMRSRDWQKFLRNAEFKFEPIELAGITFELPLIAIPK